MNSARKQRRAGVVAPATSELMRRVRRSGTRAELMVRELLVGMNVRYRVNVRSLAGTPDVANKSKRKAIFVHGCFWHRHPGCHRATLPKSNRTFWLAKFDGNCARDARKLHQLRAIGFDVLTVWECELERPRHLELRLRRFWFRHVRGAPRRPSAR